MPRRARVHIFQCDTSDYAVEQRRRKAKTAFDMRRPITLAQVLALGKDLDLLVLCKAWEVRPVYDNSVDPPALDFKRTVVRLAKHAVKHSQNEG